jgi:hypothetical protein
MHVKETTRLIEWLESARIRPAMYFGSVDIDAATHFLHGVELAVTAFLGIPIETQLQVIADRGWRPNSIHLSPQMTERGLTTAEVVDELIVIEIETLKRLAAVATNPI